MSFYWDNKTIKKIIDVVKKDIHFSRNAHHYDVIICNMQTTPAIFLKLIHSISSYIYKLLKY